MESFESPGVWSLPETPDVDVVGVVSFSGSDGWRLKIPLGRLGERHGIAYGSEALSSTPVVHGVLQNGKTVTLVDCTMTNSTTSMPGYSSEEHRALLGFVGRTPCSAEPRVDCAQCSFEHLRDWVARHPSTSKMPTAVTRSDLKADYHYETPADTVLAQGSEYAVRLQHTASLTFPSVKGFRVKHDCRISIELSEPRTFDDVDETYLQPLWTFLSFCLDRGVKKTDFSVRLAGTEEWLEVGRAQGDSASTSVDDIIMEPFMLLPLPKIENRIGSLLGQWIAFEGDERRAVSLLAGLGSDRSVPSDLRFLTSAQVLEALARLDSRNHELDPHEFERRIDLVVKAVDDKKVRDWAMRKLKYANVRPAADLLAELVANIGVYADSLAPDRRRFLDDIRDNRNFFTHRDDARGGAVLEPGELYVLTQGILCLARAAILRRLGFSEQEAADVMDGNQSSLQWKRRVSTQYHDE